MTSKRLLILSCSERKCCARGLLPAIERYNGPTFQVLRHFQREQPEEAASVDVYILSAAYGLIPADRLIPFYDQKINQSRAAELQPEVLRTFAQIIQNDYTSLCLVVGRTYLTALEGWKDLIPANLNWTVAEGPMGAKQTQLKNWLWDVPGK